MPRPPNLIVRSRLLVAARDLVHQRGFNGCGVQDITARAGIPKGSFYSYFDSKEALAIAVLDEYWRSIEDRYGPILSNASIEPLVRVENFFQGLVQDHRERGFSGGCLIGNLALELSDTSEPTRMKIRALFLTWEQMIAACLREAQMRGELDERRNTDELACILIEGYEGAVMRGKVEQDWRACDRFLDRVLPQLVIG
jgi:TetR/AcrR family transcriptional repressor of nem operon